MRPRLRGDGTPNTRVGDVYYIRDIYPRSVFRSSIEAHDFCKLVVILNIQLGPVSCYIWCIWIDAC
jgi:hypothetical protein